MKFERFARFRSRPDSNFRRSSKKIQSSRKFCRVFIARFQPLFIMDILFLFSPLRFFSLWRQERLLSDFLFRISACGRMRERIFLKAPLYPQEMKNVNGRRILFVCMGNICRSPAAEIVFRRMVEEAGLADSYRIDSAGTHGWHEGSGPDPRMAETLRRRGYRIEGRSRPMRRHDFEDFDLILGMDEENLVNIRAQDAQGRHGRKIRGFVEYLRRYDAERIPDPYYGGSQGFEHVADLVEDGCAGLLEATRAGLDGG